MTPKLFWGRQAGRTDSDDFLDLDGYANEHGCVNQAPGPYIRSCAAAIMTGASGAGARHFLPNEIHTFKALKPLARGGVGALGWFDTAESGEEIAGEDVPGLGP